MITRFTEEQGLEKQEGERDFSEKLPSAWPFFWKFLFTEEHDQRLNCFLLSVSFPSITSKQNVPSWKQKRAFEEYNRSLEHIGIICYNVNEKSKNSWPNGCFCVSGVCARKWCRQPWAVSTWNVFLRSPHRPFPQRLEQEMAPRKATHWRSPAHTCTQGMAGSKSQDLETIP